MPHPPTPGKRCTVAGCNAWAVRDQSYCAPHLHQYQDNVRLGVPEPAPRMIGPNHRLCRARSCKHLAIPNSDYCATHAEQFKNTTAAGAIIAGGFSTLLDRLNSATPDCLAALQREMDLLTAARKILVAHAEMSSRSGWRAISSMTFIRLWLSSATTANDLIKSRFVMENASGADVDRLLGGVYTRMERDPVPEQRPLPGMPSILPEQSLLPGLEPTPLASLTTPEEQLAEWFIEANASLGTRTILLITAAYARENPDAEQTASALSALAAQLPVRVVDQAPSPPCLAERLSTLAEIMQHAPDLDHVRRLLGAGAATDAQS